MMAAIIWLVFMSFACLVIYLQWQSGKLSITGIWPKSKVDRVRAYWILGGALNFLAFILHVFVDGGASAFPAGGVFEAGEYMVRSHGRVIPFSPSSFWFNYVHGLFFIVAHLVCSIAVWRMSRKAIAPLENGAT
jgi:hypothetical protein